MNPIEVFSSYIGIKICPIRIAYMHTWFNFGFTLQTPSAVGCSSPMISTSVNTLIAKIVATPRFTDVIRLATNYSIRFCQYPTAESVFVKIKAIICFQVLLISLRTLPIQFPFLPYFFLLKHSLLHRWLWLQTPNRTY